MFSGGWYGLRTIFVPFVGLLLCACGGSGSSDTPGDGSGHPDALTEVSGDSSGDAWLDVSFEYAVPLAPDAPWPKFRRDCRQTGSSPVLPKPSGEEPWVFKTAKGIFSTPVVGADETIFVGSADRVFYALNSDGTEKWRVQTGEIIDSSALLDDQGRVYFGSGDGKLYARDAQTGGEVWTFLADDPAEHNAFIRWFEGNVAIGLDGTLYVPNDNFYLYAIDRNSGQPVWKFEMPDQTWSAPAVDPETGNLYIGNNNLLPLLGDNVFAITPGGEELWSASIPATVAASPVLTEGGKVVLGGFDGFLHAQDQDVGDELWFSAARDHIYASPGRLSDGTLVQPSADGTVYGIDPDSGDPVWAFDTLDPIRSSPAIDGKDNIYVGSGEGRLYVINPDGTLRWSMQLIGGDRNDLNASPALGRKAIYIAGESGEIFSVPYDWCLGEAGLADERCSSGVGEQLPNEGAHLLFTSRMGSPLSVPPESIFANQAMAFWLLVREQGDTTLALIETDSLEVEVTPAVSVTVEVSGGRRFVTVVPDGLFVADGDGLVSLRVTGQYLVNPDREGLKMTGGTLGGSFDETFDFEVKGGTATDFPLPVAQVPGEDTAVMEMYRLAAPLPTILPSYNQIGFDSLHYLVGYVQTAPGTMVGWVVGGMLDETTGLTVADPATRALFPVRADWSDGLLTLATGGGFSLEAMNATLSFDSFRVSMALDAQGETLEPAVVNVSTLCASIQLYGAFLQQLGFCNPQTDILAAFGATLMRPHQGGVGSMPAGLSDAQIVLDGKKVVATFDQSALQSNEHRFGILLVDSGTGLPVSLDYGLKTTQKPAPDGTISQVVLDLGSKALPGPVDAWLMVDTYPAAVKSL